MHKTRHVAATMTTQGRNSKNVNKKAMKNLSHIFLVSVEDENIHVKGRKQTTKGTAHADNIKRRTRRHVIRVTYLSGRATATKRSAVTTHKLQADE